MKPKVQIVFNDGSLSYMYEDGTGKGDPVICGEKFAEFSVNVPDYGTDNSSANFVFEPKDVGRIFALVLGKDTAFAVETITRYENAELYNLIEQAEVTFCYEAEGTEMFDAIHNGNAFGDKFFWRMRQNENLEWQICFVFHGVEIGSIWQEWMKFNPGPGCPAPWLNRSRIETVSAYAAGT